MGPSQIFKDEQDGDHFSVRVLKLADSKYNSLRKLRHKVELTHAPEGKKKYT